MRRLHPEQKAKVAKWLELLDANDHEQGQYYLKALHGDDNIPHYCCLGVAAEAVLGRQFIRVAPNDHALVYESDEDVEGIDRQATQLSSKDSFELGLNKMIYEDEIDKLAELTDLPVGSIRSNSREGVCVQLNDRADFTFPEIANVIKEMGWDQ